MNSRIEQATVALVALLAAGVPAATVQRNRDIPVDFITSDTAYLIVKDGPIQTNPQAQIAEHTVTVYVDGYVKSADYEALGPALDALLTPTYATIMGTPRLGVSEPYLSYDVRMSEGDGIGRGLDDGDGEPVESFRITVTMKVNTKHNDLTIAA